MSAALLDTNPLTAEDLKAMGLDISESQYPYTYHHDFVLRKRKKGSRADIAHEYAKFSEEHPPEIAEAALYLGAFGEISSQNDVQFQLIMDRNWSLFLRLSRYHRLLEGITCLWQKESV